MSALVLTALACAKSVPPQSANDPIPLSGAHVELDSIDEGKYLHYAVGTHIEAPPEVVWEVLTTVDGYPEWNSTVSGLTGDIEAGGQLELEVFVAPGRTFPITVSVFEPATRMVWQDGNDTFKGVRTHTLTAVDGGTDWTMKEALTGRMLPMIAKKLPDFGPDFDTYAADLKREAESRVPEPVANPAEAENRPEAEVATRDGE